MPTNTNAYNSRVTDEALEKRFRDTFRSQGGAELVDDLYAQGVIVPIVDFTAAATGQQLAENLQTAWDFSTGYNSVAATTADLVTNAGFWQVDLTCFISYGASGNELNRIYIDDGTSEKNVWAVEKLAFSGINEYFNITDGKFVVFLRSGDTLRAEADTFSKIDVWYRQIATVNGDLVNPTGFTSS
jgi:hypothetical protein